MLLDIADIIFAPSVTTGLTGFLSHLISDHHTHFVKLFGDDKRLMPKHHFMVHYPSCIIESGPPVRYWCMRFGARHRFFKDLGRLSHGYKNICQTLANRFQLSLASFLLNAGALKSHVQVGLCKDVLVRSLGDEVAEVICCAVHIGLHDIIYLANWVTVGHYTFQKQTVVVTDIVDGLPLFGIVHKILALANDVWFVLSCLKTMAFDEHFHSYVIEYYDQRKLLCVSLHNVKDHIPLQVCKVDYDGSYSLLVSTRYCLF
jgi:hypothetical protein